MFQITVSDVGNTKLSHPRGSAKASFDLLKTFGRDVFRSLIEDMDLKFHESEVGYIWHNSEVVIRTYNHPLTGIWFYDRNDVPEREDPDSYLYPKENRLNFKRRFNLGRVPEPAYFSYVHVVGDADAVNKVFEHLNENGTHEGASPESWIV